MVGDARPKYIIYCRKSTDEPGKQVQSITDQMKYCIDYLERNEYEIELRPNNYDDDFLFDREIDREVLERPNHSEYHEKARKYFLVIERETAYKPHVRKKWKKIMQLVKLGKIKGIFSYAPDRHARNMLEAGEILDQIDKFAVDVQYCNHTFVNNSSGKMMLTMLFGFAKHYSDQRSDLTTRGTREKLLEGYAMGSGKYGYIINDQGYFEPDGYNFELMRSAFIFKLYQHKTNEEILEYLNKHGFILNVRVGKRNELYGKKKYISKKLKNSDNLGEVWKDTIYYGMYRYGKHDPTDQRVMNPFFEEMISKSEYDELQKLLGYRRREIVVKKSGKENDLLRPFESGVVVDEQGNKLQFEIGSKGRLRKKLEQLQSTKPESTLADVIQPHQMRYRLKIGEDKLVVSAEKLMNAFSLELAKFNLDDETKVLVKKSIVKRMKENNSEMRKLSKVRKDTLARLNKDYDSFVERSLGNIGSYDEKQKEVYESKVNDFKDSIKAIENEIQELEESKRDLQKEAGYYILLLSDAVGLYDEFDYVRKRKLASQMVLNIVISPNGDCKIKLKPILENFKPRMVTDTGLEPVTSAMSMQRSRQLS